MYILCWFITKQTMKSNFRSIARTVLSFFILVLLSCIVGIPVHAACLSEPGNPGTPTNCGVAASNATSTQGNTSAVSFAASNPINVINGNKYQEEIDMPALPGEFGLELVRHYNSSLHAFGYTGYGWRLSYETELHAIHNTIQINQADGYRIIFNRDYRDPTICTPNDPARGTIIIHKTARGEEYTWIWTNGRSLYFNHLGKLERITSASGQTMNLYRGLKGELVKVTDPQGRSMTFEYANRKSKGFRGIVAVNTPVGRYEYQHDDDKQSAGFGNLLSVKYPQEKIGTHGQNTAEKEAFSNISHIERHYHYAEIIKVEQNKNNLPEKQQAAHFLTGITVNWQDAQGQAQHQRINTWGYNAQGRAIFSVLGPYGSASKQAGPGQLALSFSNPDQYTDKDTQKQEMSKQQVPRGHNQHEHNSLVNTTILTNSLGQRTHVKHSVIAGQYRLIEVTGAGCSSCPETNMQYRYDHLARLVDTIKLNPDGQPLYIIRQTYDKASRVKEINRIDYAQGKAQPARLIRRFEYPVLAQDKADAIQKTKGYEAVKLTQQTYAVYNQPKLIATPSVVKGKEHQWHISYNENGQPLKMTETGYRPALPTDKVSEPTPIARSISYQYKPINGKSLLVQIDGPLPNGKTNTPQDSDITQYAYDKQGWYLTKVTAPMIRVTNIEYDEEHGRVSKVSNSDGEHTSFVYNLKGSPLEVVMWNQQDSINRQIHQFKYDVFGSQKEYILNHKPQILREFDTSGRLIWQVNHLGFIKQLTYDTEDRLLSTTMKTRNYEQGESYQYDQFNRLISTQESDGRIKHRAVYPSNNLKQLLQYQSIYDDFGRVVLEYHADDGAVFKQYNQANQLIEQTNLKGGKLLFKYNLAGQRIQQAASSNSHKSEVTNWEFQHNKLVAIDHPHQNESFKYNAQGKPIVHTVKIKLNNDTQVTHTTTYHYDGSGQLQSQSLPDGTKLLYQRNGQAQVTALVQQVTPWTLFGLGQQTIVKDLSRDMIGLSHITYGNGIQGDWQRSQQGILARIVYSNPAALNKRESPQLISLQDTLTPMVDSFISNAHAQETVKVAIQSTSTLPGALGLPKNPNALFDERLIYHEGGDVLLQQQAGQGIQLSKAYAYDRHHQLLAAQSEVGKQSQSWRYHYDHQGNRDLAQEGVLVTAMDQTTKVSYGLTTNAAIRNGADSASAQHYQWNALGQLVAVKQGQQNLSQYTYNAYGLRIKKQHHTSQGEQTTYTLYNMQRQRIADLNAQGHITRQYIWLGDQLVATSDNKTPQALQATTDGFLNQLRQTISYLWQQTAGDADRLAFVHINHLHAPVAVTDSQGKVIWQADYAPYGGVIKTVSNAQSYQLALRNAGQWQDEETGLYYNDFRYYNPQTGRYISVDPLDKLATALGSPNPYSYVNNNPISYIDPWGLILFAFDGTENTDDLAWLHDPDRNSSLSNVMQFRGLYNDGNTEYITGVGTVHTDHKYDDIPAPLLDAGVTWTGDDRSTRMVKYFDNESNDFDDNTVMDVDIIGFSRGAAQARDFANQIVAHTQNGWYSYKDDAGKAKCQKVNFRFMGLWDTVLSDNWSGHSYNLAIPLEFSYVAQAVALNEYRGHTLPLGRANPFDTHSWGSFPLESIMGSVIPATQTRIEKGFIGAHADIGGGFAEGQNELAQVALAWMYEQAKTAHVKMLDTTFTIKASPVIHDKSDVIRFGSPNTGSALQNDGEWNDTYSITTNPIVGSGAEDREVRYLDGSETTQRQMTGTGLTNAETEQFITYDPQRNRSDNVTGIVDMQAYLNWLNDNGYEINMTVQ